MKFNNSVVKCWNCNGEIKGPVNYHECPKEETPMNAKPKRKLNPLYEKMQDHYCHNIEIRIYGDKKKPDNIAIECLDCNEVIIDAKREENS